MYNYIQNMRMKFLCSEISNFLIKNHFLETEKPIHRQTTKQPKKFKPDFLASKGVPYHILKCGRFLPKHPVYSKFLIIRKIGWHGNCRKNGRK